MNACPRSRCRAREAAIGNAVAAKPESAVCQVLRAIRVAAASRLFAASLRSAAATRERSGGLPYQGSNPIPRRITLVTVCTAFSNCMSDSGWCSLMIMIWWSKSA